MGLSPQEPLEAAILREGGFDGIAAGACVSELLYVRLSGNNPPGKSILLELKVNKSDPPQISPDDAADEARRKLEALIRAFENEDQAYTSLNLSMWSNRYGRYDDLARVWEWSALGFGEDMNEFAPRQYPGCDAARRKRGRRNPASSACVSAKPARARPMSC